jgi:hypothetical protein
MASSYYFLNLFLIIYFFYVFIVCADIKNNFLKIKNFYFNVFLNKINILKGYAL